MERVDMSDIYREVSWSWEETMKEISKMAPERCAKLKDFSEAQRDRPLQRQSMVYEHTW